MKKAVRPSTVLQSTHAGTPWVAVCATALVLVLALVLDGAGYLSLDRMLSLAGQNFLVLYGIAAAGLLVQAKGLGERALSSCVVVLVLGLVAAQGTIALYPAALVGTGIVLGALKPMTPRTHRQNPQAGHQVS